MESRRAVLARCNSPSQTDRKKALFIRTARTVCNDNFVGLEDETSDTLSIMSCRNLWYRLSLVPLNPSRMAVESRKRTSASVS